MPLNVGPLLWQSRPNAATPIAYLNANAFPTDGIIRCQLRASYLDAPVSPRYIGIDNYGNGHDITVTIDATPPFRVFAYTRFAFPIPDNANFVSLTGTSGDSVALTFFVEAPPADYNTTNALAVGTAIQASAVFPFIQYNGATNQVIGDNDHNVLFALSGSAAYTLLPIASTPVANGWFQFIENSYNSTENAILTLTPSGTDTINFGAGCTLYPGESCYLKCDGTRWFAIIITKKMPQISGTPINVNGTQSLNDEGRFVTFNPTAADITFTLIASGSALNGYSQFCYNQPSSTKKVTLTAFAGDTIVGDTVLYPGDYAIMILGNSTFWLSKIIGKTPPYGSISATAKAIEFGGQFTGNGTLTLPVMTDIAKGGWVGYIRATGALTIQRGGGSGNIFSGGFSATSQKINAPFTTFNARSDNVIINTDGSNWELFGTRSYDSGDQTITSAGTLVLAHGLSKAPDNYVFYIHCATAEANFAIGDYVLVNVGANYGTNYGVSVWIDATNINIRFGSGVSVFSVPNKTTGVGTNLTNGNWRFGVRAYIHD